MELQYRPIPFKDVVRITNLVQVEYIELPNNFAFPFERHKCWELDFVDQGFLNGYVNGKEFHLDCNEMILHPPMMEHGIDKPTESTPNLLNFCFESNSLSLYRLAGRPIRVSQKSRKILNRILEYAYTFMPGGIPLNSIDEGLIENNQYNQLMLQLIVHSIEEFFLQVIYEEVNEEKDVKILKQNAINQKNNLSEQVVRYIDQNIAYNLSLEQISNHFNISVGKLCRDIKKTYNKSVHEIINQQRLKFAKIMIRERENNFTEIAENLGFSSIYYFSQWFKKQTGMSPTDYALSMYPDMRK